MDVPGKCGPTPDSDDPALTCLGSHRDGRFVPVVAIVGIFLTRHEDRNFRIIRVDRGDAKVVVVEYDSPDPSSRRMSVNLLSETMAFPGFIPWVLDAAVIYFDIRHRR